jgi:hypothetical protein
VKAFEFEKELGLHKNLDLFVVDATKCNAPHINGVVGVVNVDRTIDVAGFWIRRKLKSLSGEELRSPLGRAMKSRCNAVATISPSSSNDASGISIAISGGRP